MFSLCKGSHLPIPEECWLLQFDGGCHGNPGVASGGAVLWAPGSPRKKVVEVGEWIPHGTNNIAEYTGLCIGLEVAIQYGVKTLCIEGDSNLVVNQMLRKWKVNHPGLKPLFEKAQDLLQLFESVGIRHVYRQFNADADAITNEVIWRRGSYKNVFQQPFTN